MTPAEKLRMAFAMHDTGVAMHRLTLRRRYPDLTEGEIDARLAVWLCERPGAEFGDCVGTPRLVAP